MVAEGERCLTGAGDGGNIERLYKDWVNHTSCPPDTGPDAVTKCPTYQGEKHDEFCPNEQPSWSAYRRAHLASQQRGTPRLGLSLGGNTGPQRSKFAMNISKGQRHGLVCEPPHFVFWDVSAGQGTEIACM